MVKNTLCGNFHRITKNFCSFVAFGITKKLKAFTQRTELAKTVPTEVIFSLQLLHMFWSRTTCACFKQTATLHKFHNGQHFCRRGQLQDWKQVSQIITQNVASYWNCIFAFSNRFKRSPRCLTWCHNLELICHTFGSQHWLHIGDQLCIVSATSIKPENRTKACHLLTLNGQIYPVFDRGLTCGCRAPNITCLNRVFV